MNNPGNRDYAYWADRGFIGKDSDVLLRNWLFSAQEYFWFEMDRENTSITHLSLPSTPSLLNLEHYYKIFILSSSIKMAVSFMATPFNGNRFLAIINRDGSNEGIIEINLELMSNGVTPNTTIFHAGGETGADARSSLSFDFAQFEPRQLQHAASQLFELFKNHT